MVKLKALISTAFLLAFSVWTTYAQGNCAFDVSSVIERVTNDCANVGENQVCYGNHNVNATPRLNTLDFIFENPGDIADLYNIQSLVVDAVNAQENTWGVAQMRLQVSSDEGTQDVIMLLFGAFSIENAVADTNTVELIVQAIQVSVRSEPSTAAAQLEIAGSGNTLIAVGRLADTSWLRVENPVTGIVGWIENQGIGIVDTVLGLDDLPEQNASDPYFGAMQAFYFENGTSDIGCDSLESDGLLIQTPEGAARISLLINEVSIELVGGRNASGETESGTALIQANPQSEQGMIVNVVQGQATVETEQGTQTVQSGQQSSIPITVNIGLPGFSPSSAPSNPVDVDLSDVNISPLISAISAPSNNSSSSSGGAFNVTTGNGSSNNNSSSNNSSNNSSSGGFDVTLGNGSNSGSSGSNNSSSSSSSSSGDGSSTGDSNNPLGSSSTGISSPEISGNNQTFKGFGEQGNIIALMIAGIAGVLLLVFMLWFTGSRQK